MRLKPVFIAALGTVAALPLLAVPAHAGQDTCQAAFCGSHVGDLSISSSHSCFAHAVSRKDEVAIDRVQVDPCSGMVEYRLAEDVDLIDWRTDEPFVGGTGYSFVPSAGTEIKDECVDKELGGVRGPFDL